MIQFQSYTGNRIADYQDFSASGFSSCFAALGDDIAVEESTSHGRLDMAVRAAGHVYPFEFKVAGMTPPGSALAQLRERRYADECRATGEPIHLVGVEFSRDTRTITAFDTADAWRASSHREPGRLGAPAEPTGKPRASPPGRPHDPGAAGASVNACSRARQAAAAPPRAPASGPAGPSRAAPETSG